MNELQGLICQKSNRSHDCSFSQSLDKWFLWTYYNDCLTLKNNKVFIMHLHAMPQGNIRAYSLSIHMQRTLLKFLKTHNSHLLKMNMILGDMCHCIFILLTKSGEEVLNGYPQIYYSHFLVILLLSPLTPSPAQKMKHISADCWWWLKYEKNHI